MGNEGSWLKVDFDTEGFQRSHDVAKYNGRIERISAQWLEGDFRGNRRIPGHFDKRGTLFDPPVLGQIAPCLTHDPNRHAFLRVTPDRL